MKRLELWMGRAGSMKSRTIAAQIAAEVSQHPIGDKIYWIVPETASFAAEQMLMDEVSTTIRAEVVTLSRFAERLEREARLGDGETINRTGQRLLLAHVLQESSSHLNLLHRARPTLGFLDSILDAFDEMSAHLVSMDGLQGALEIASAQVLDTPLPPVAHAGRRLLGKLHDLCALYFLYQREMAARGLVDPSQRVVALMPHLARLPSLHGSQIYLDGFQSLQPREFEFFMGLAEVASDVVVSVSADASWFHNKGSEGTSTGTLIPASSWNASLQGLLEDTPEPEAVYGPSQLRWVRAFVEACEQRDWACFLRSFEREGVGRRPDMSHLESKLFGLSRTPFVPKSEDDADRSEGQGISVFAAQNIRAEANGVAQDILRRVQGGQVRFRDVVIVVPDVEGYAPYLKESFRRHGVPLDSSDAPSLGTHPLGKFLLASLAVVEERLSTASAIRILKTEFTGLSREDADWLEGYLLRHGVSGLLDWSQPWNFSADRSERGQNDQSAIYEDNRAGGLRERLEPIYGAFYQALSVPEITPLKLAETIWKLLDDLRVKRTVAGWVVDDSTALPHQASLHEQAWQRMIAILGDLARTMPDLPLSRGFLFQSVREDILSQSLAAVPAGLDAVLVLDVERAMAVHRKVSYVMGVVDGALPRRIRSTGLLQDDEREQFWRLFGTRVGDTGEDRQLRERFAIYTALTRGDDALVLTYPMANADGKEVQPSSVLSMVEAMFPGQVTRGWWPEGESGDNVVWTPRTALLHVVSALRDAYVGLPAKHGTSALFHSLERDTLSRQLLSQSLRGIVHKARALPISFELAGRLYGEPMRMNVYQLETAASCAFRHFLQYGLRLNDTETADLSAAERGTLIHAALAEFVSFQQQDVESAQKMEDAQAETVMAQIFERLLERPENQVWTKSATRRAQAYEAESVAKRAAIVLKRHLEHSRFAPYQLEFAFGTGEDGALPPYRMELGDGTVVELRGRLDRVDLAEEDGQTYFRIIDYKSRVMDIELAKVHHGIRLQLAVYSSVVKSHAPETWGTNAKSAGFFYLPLVRKVETENGPIDGNEAFEKAISRMKVRGLWLGDDRPLRWMDERLVTGGDSELFPKMYKKDGTFAKTAPVLSSDEWEAMERAVIRRVQMSAEQVHSGDISIEPYAFSRQDTACVTCSFAAVCQIDTRWDGSQFRKLEKPGKTEVLASWLAEEAGV